MKTPLNESHLDEMKLTPLNSEELAKVDGGGWFTDFFKRFSFYGGSRTQASRQQQSVTVDTIPGHQG
jgi:hypothetical protein